MGATTFLQAGETTMGEIASGLRDADGELISPASVEDDED